MNSKRFLSTILCIVIVLSTMSFTTFAEDIVVATIGEVEYATLEEAVTNAKNGDTITIMAGTYDMPEVQGKNITFKGAENKATTINMSHSGANNSSITFDGIVAVWPDGNEYGTPGYYSGLAHIENLTYKNSTIKGKQFLYATGKALFENCEFENKTDNYCVWTYGASDVTFEGCIFNTDGKAILVYTEGAHTAEINVNNCTFNAATNRGKAAVEIGQSAYGNKANYALNITESTADANFIANNSTSNLWGNKNSMAATDLNVNIDDEAVYAPVAVATIGDTVYYSLADAFDYAKANDGSVITLLTDLDLSDWTAVNMDVTAFTLDGNNKTITGLKTALIDSVATGEKEVVIKDLTIKGANNAGLHSDHSGAVNAGGLINVIGYVKLTLENINIVDSVIGGDSTAYAGGLIGYVGATAESVYEINSCSVKNTTITCTSSAGGLFGHSNGGLTTISETTVGANTIKGEKAAKEGSLIGTLTSCAGTKIDVTETTESTGTGTLNVIGRVYTGVTYTGGSYFTDPEMASATNDSTEITIADGFGVEVSDEKYIVKDITARSLTVVADKDVAYVDDTVEVEIKIDGTNITFADYTFKYDGNIFTCADDTDNDGEIEYNTYKQTEGDVFASGEVLATYTLKVKAQATDNVTTALSLSSDSKAGNDNDSINGVSAETTLVDDSVTIKFRTLDAVVVKVDGNTETATSKDIPYDMCNHTFEATTATEGAKVEYAVTFEGNSSSIDAIKEIGTYEITYTITKDGYTPIIGSFTIEIIEPLYEIEIVKDYVKGKVAVLVYTNVTDVCYNYDGNLMIDVSAKNYTYNETHYTSVFGYVTNPLTDENGDNTLDKAVYAEKLGLVKPTSELLEVIAVDNDLNVDNNVDQYDINAAYGVYNVRSAYFTNANAMKIVLKADVSCDKIVDNTDNVAVYNAFYNPTTTD